MELYRSIGDKELIMLLTEQTIVGQYDCSAEIQTTVSLKNAVCFFIDHITWMNSNHKYVIKVEIPDNQLYFGIGTYYAADSLKKDYIWSGRDGKNCYKIREAYTFSYSINDVTEMFFFNHFANHFIIKNVGPICEKYNIIFHNDSTIPFKNEKQIFVKENNHYYIKNDKLPDLHNFNEEKFIEETMSELRNHNLTIEQAFKIRSILRESIRKERNDD